MRRIYMDHNATTPIHPQVVEAMMPLFQEAFGNPSSIHLFGREAKKYMEDARQVIANFIGADPSEIVFTSCGSESDNLAILGIAESYSKKGNHIITTQVEHPAVLGACRYLERKGYEVTYLPVDSSGLLDPQDVRKAITPKTILVTIMYANNETGVIFPIEEISKVTQESRVLFHSDAVQAAGKIPLDVRRLGVDLLSMSAHKLNAPKGIGALYVKRGVKLKSIFQGGHQEKGRRPGTENIPYIVGFAKACEIAKGEMREEAKRLSGLRDRLWQGIQERVPFVYLNGHPDRRLPNTLNFCVEYIEGEGMLLNLDMSGIAVSSGSACTSGTLEPSHVLIAMGVAPDLAQGALRISLGYGNTEEDVDYLLEVFPPIVERLRNLSPLWARMKREGPEAVREALLKMGSSETFQKLRKEAYKREEKAPDTAAKTES